ncbi:hypothetical protein ACGFJ7_07660 [Actinoplanes sp. NPDC048988]|uniref:hypothetical protein n=1 Tax=Actinoplanes sp. NPDC048988 TaxID=3363901 RepID=UPI00371CF117
MKTYKLTLGLAAALALTVSGCGLLDDEPARVLAESPRETLLKTVPDEKAPAYAFDVKGAVQPISGVLDAPNKTTQFKITHSEDGVTLSMSGLLIDDRSWMRLSLTGAEGFPALPRKWMPIDPKKVKNPDDVPISYDDEVDPGYADLIIRSSEDVRVTSPDHYAGTTDLTASTEAEIVEDATLTALGAKAKAVPFEAVVGPDGHLSTLLVKVPAAGKAKAVNYRVTYAGYGRTITPKAPTETAKPTEAVYDLINS